MVHPFGAGGDGAVLRRAVFHHPGQTQRHAPGGSVPGPGTAFLSGGAGKGPADFRGRNAGEVGHLLLYHGRKRQRTGLSRGRHHPVRHRARAPRRIFPGSGIGPGLADSGFHAPDRRRRTGAHSRGAVLCAGGPDHGAFPAGFRPGRADYDGAGGADRLWHRQTFPAARAPHHRLRK